MAPQAWMLVTVYVGALVSAAMGLLRPTRAHIRLIDLSVVLAGCVLAFLLRHDSVVALSAGSLFPSVYETFGLWQRSPGSPKKAFFAAFLGAMFFLLMTTQSWAVASFAAAFGLGGPYAAVWLTRRTHRAVGLGMLILATVFAVTRVPLLLAREPLTPHFTTVHE
ncbi:MAG: hypothetical protein ABI548_20680 [Polyangiaceae bacterium]